MDYFIFSVFKQLFFNSSALAHICSFSPSKVHYLSSSPVLPNWVSFQCWNTWPENKSLTAHNTSAFESGFDSTVPTHHKIWTAAFCDTSIYSSKFSAVSSYKGGLLVSPSHSILCCEERKANQTWSTNETLQELMVCMWMWCCQMLFIRSPD